ncbi:uncharacterized protein LOC119767173 isoform X1 [Culex quinquefasciatus]|uniref:uncharacterized protein LOC119767173 isoform X1 n=1 Tax=Culex quinquefasciatus TaxID=7176 RepID=UPI0018E3B2CA|nr:uncharacterized protein LOC119767173 isoform X1 [Culex quinquefasciatus]
MQILTFITVFGAVLCGQSSGEEAKTFPGAEIIIPAVIGQVLPGLISGIVGGIAGGIAPAIPQIPPISTSHSTVLVTSVADKPVAVSFHSHSGTISTSASGPSTSAGSHGSVSSSSLVSASSQAGSKPAIFGLSKRWQKFIKSIG